MTGALSRENGERSSAKKARVQPPPGYGVKQEVHEEDDEEVPIGEEDEEASGGLASAAAVDAPAAAARVEVVVRIDKDMLHCPVCTLPLKPPIFQCAVGHMACGSCHGQLPTKQCHSCGGGGGGSPYERCPAMDAFVAKAVVPCPHQAHGCRASVAYCNASEHGSECPHAPCACGEPGCAFVGPPPALLAHLAAAPHSWPVDEVRYGETLRLRVPEPEARRLLVAEEGGEQRALFVLAVGDRGARAVPVTLACVRAPGAAAAGPQYTCKMWTTGSKAPATGKVESVLVDMEVLSAAAAGAVAADGDEEAMFLWVPRKMLRGASRQMFLSVRIDRVSA